MKFKSNIEIQAGLEDASGSPGTVNQLLSSTATGTAWIDPSTIVAEAATLVVIACKNTSGAAIAQGTPVYQTGTVGATATIEIAPADALISANKLPAIGLLQTALNNNGFGFVVITGELTNFTTSPIDGVVPTTGDKVFVKSGGGLTLTKPTGEGNGIQNMGLVGKVSGGNAGSITVSSIMRTNDVPNLPEGRIWVGDGNTIVSDTVYIDEPNNRVGIGTTSPSQKLDVNGNVNIDGALFVNTTNNHIRLVDTDNTGNFSVGVNTNFQIRDTTANTTPLTIRAGTPSNTILTTASGRVGIGLSSPGATLHVGGFARLNGGLQMNATNATIYQILDSALRFGTNNTERMRIDNTGNVGIGTTSPIGKLNVSKDSTTDGLSQAITVSSSSVSTKRMNLGYVPGSNYAFIDVINYAISNTNQALSLQPNGGNVGIGTTSPQASLQIGNAVGTSSERLDVRGNSSGNYVASFEQDHITGYGLLIDTDGTLVSQPVLKIKNASSELFYVGSNGNVGIGTSSPSAKLDIHHFTSGGNDDLLNIGLDATNPTRAKIYTENYDGNFGLWDSGSTQQVKVSSDGNSYFNGGNVGIGTTSPSTRLEVSASATTSVDIAHFSNSNGSAKIKHSLDGVGSGQISIFDASNNEDIRLSTQSDSWFNAGNVGIGTTSPAYKLDVEGSANNADIAIRINNTFDDNLATSNPTSVLWLNAASNNGYLRVHGAPANTAAKHQIDLGSTAGSSFLTFSPGGAEKMRITTLGGISFGSTGTAYGSSGQVLTSGGDASPTWTTPTTGTVTGSGSATQVAFWDGESSLTGSQNLYWDSTNNHLGIGDSTPGSKLKVTGGTSETSIYTVDINHVRNDANVATQAMRLNVDLSGADTTTADRTNSGLFLDLDSSANGDATHEHRIKGIHSDVRFSGFSDSVQSGYFYAESNYTGAKTAQLIGVLGQATHDTSSTDGGVSNMYGVLGSSSIQDLGDVDNAFGGYFSVTISTNRGSANVGVTKGVEGHIDIDKAETITYGEMMAVSGIIDNNEGTVPTFGNQYLFKGDYQGTKGGNAYGIYCEGDKHYFDGNVGIGTTSPQSGYKLHLESTTHTKQLIETSANSAYSILQLHNSFDDTYGTFSLSPSGKLHIGNEATGVSDHLVIDSGNVGIGTTSPGYPFSLESATTGLISRIYNTNADGQGLLIRAGATTSATRVFQAASSDDTKIMTVNSNGNVGIGTDSPGAKLEVNVGVNSLKISGRDTYIDSSIDSANANIYVTQAGVGDFSQLAGSLVLQARTQGTVYRDIIFAGGLTSGDALMTIQGEGNVGIGTTSPSNKLEVVGSNAVRIHDGTDQGSIFFRGDRDDVYIKESNYQLLFGAPSGMVFELDTNLNDNDVFNVMHRGSSRMYINGASGNVGIGTTSPSAKLEVEGLGVANTPLTLIKAFNTIPYATGNGQGSATIEIGHNQMHGYIEAGSVSEASSAAGYMAFGHRLQTNITNEAMRIAYTGNVGIGTTSPQQLLHVAKSNAPAGIEIQGGLNAITAVGDVHGFIDFGTNDGSATGGIAGRIESLSETTNGAHNGLAFYTGRQNRTPYLQKAMQIGSTGAISFGSNALDYGSAGEILVSNGNASPSWDAASTVIGGPYLPLAGGTLTGGLTINLSSEGTYFTGGSSAIRQLSITSGTNISANALHTFNIASSNGKYEFDVNGTTEFSLDSSSAVFTGKVGIGTTSPEQDLHIDDATGNSLIRFSGGAANNETYDIGQGIAAVSNGGFGFRNIAENKYAMVFQDVTCNVGIGTTSPIAPLHITGPAPISTQPVIKVERTSPVVDYQDTNPTNGYLFFTERFSNLAGSVISTRKVMQNPGGSGVYTNFNHGFLTGQGTEHNQRNNSFHWKIDNSTNEVLTISTSGNVGIGTTNPNAKLNVNGGIKIEGTNSLSFGGTVSIPAWGINSSGNDLIINDQATTVGDVLLTNAGNVGIGTTSTSYKLDVSGNGRFTSTVTAANFILSSDERLKENIEKACDNRIKADWKTFELKTDKGQKRYGVIAQELEKTNPEFVREDTQGFKSVAYIDLLIAKIAELEARLEKLEK